MQMIRYYRKNNVFVNCAVCFSLLHIRIANKLEVDATISGWSKAGLKKKFFLIECGFIVLTNIFDVVAIKSSLF